jgi:hypothetical protein
MRLARLGFLVGEGHLHEGIGRGVAVLQALEDGPAEGVGGLLRHGADGLAIALDDEMGDAALQIGLGLPGEVLPVTTTFVGAGGGVVSGMAVSLTYCIQALATASFGSHTAFRLVALVLRGWGGLGAVQRRQPGGRPVGIRVQFAAGLFR